MFYTTIEQSKKLLKLGLSPESADKYWLNQHCRVIDDETNLTLLQTYYKQEYAYPCWSVGALLEVMPRIDGFKPIIDLDVNCIYYEGRNETINSADTLTEAAYNMVVWLIENNYIKNNNNYET